MASFVENGEGKERLEKMRKLSVVLSVFLALALSINCGKNRGFSPTEPSIINPELTPTEPGGNAPPSTNPVAQDVLAKWRQHPYVNIHADGGAERAYSDALDLLLRNGALRGARIEIENNSVGLNNSLIQMVGSKGVEVLGLISNHFLLDNNVEQNMDNIIKAYRGRINYFQVGNEITTILSPSERPTIEQYMKILKRAYDHVRRNYPEITLLSQSPLGSGSYGKTELEKMADLGLTSMCSEGLIVAVNVYTLEAINAYAGTINSRLGGCRIWITETGIANPDRHMQYVQDTFPLLNALRPERVYWYAFWAGDNGPNSGHGLIRNPYDFPNYWKSPLLKILAGQ